MKDVGLEQDLLWSNRTVSVVMELNDIFRTLFVGYFKQENILSAVNLVPSERKIKCSNKTKLL